MRTQEIKANLLQLFNSNVEQMRNLSVDDLFDDLINDDTAAFNMDSGEMGQLYDVYEINAFKKAKKNSKLISAFETAKSLKFNHDVIVENLKNDILNSISEIKNKIRLENKGFKNQIIFLEYDFQPYAYLCGFGKGNYPILKKPEYFEFNFEQELYSGIGRIDYSVLWKDLNNLNEILEDLDIFFQICETELYQCILNSVVFKTYLFLNEAFEKIGIGAFDGIDIEKPLFIYGNEHDSEAMNIYVFE